ncbi:methionine ABC transporter ATP-binding protein [Aureimonas fodinaquatilis]|uniref:Cell division ATP-binding protein FtsE n=1 Tax=Aureimonas fodinaquatilis TaxID=2565783 RepID=A0A5B0DSB4_9HYPH|nr:methionine ABC transporter ATP-binding protein [Aureimonas fodinaquatilis]KAA0969694.1 methionine ABC transporter ATP-binding protein [Aureimonas fodinaquatilis]
MHSAVPDHDDHQSPILRLNGVSKRFGEHAAISDINLTIHSGEILGIIGRSGAGKSTLIRCINGLVQPDQGTVEVEGRAIAGLSESELQPVRRRIGMVFQHFNLLANKTVAQNIALPLKIAGRPRPERQRRVLELLELVGLSGREHNYPAQLSGGQKQRVGIARALAAEPALLLSDEATSALDPETTEQILRLLGDINKRLGLTILLITHEMEVIRRIAQRVIVLDSGRIVEEGQTWRIFATPQSAITRKLLGSVLPEAPATLLAQLNPNAGEEAIFRLDLGGPGASAPILSDIARQFNASLRLVGGGMDDIQGQPVGRLFLAVRPQSPADIPAITNALAGHTLQTELLGYVSGTV